MKRVLTFLAIMLLPLSVMAMTPVSDQTLSDVTGQAGVNINADLRMDISIGTLAWGDTDGIGSMAAFGWTPSDSGGYVGITGFNITNLRIKARETDDFDTYVAPTQLKPITIDVATGGAHGSGITYVRFGLGSLEISMNAMSFGVELGATTELGQQLGVVSIGPLALYIDPTSYVDIFAKDGCGVNIYMDVEIDQLSLSYVSWGDLDGQVNPSEVPTTPWMGDAAAGYVGLENLVIGGPITVVGEVAIDVNTVAAGTGIYGNHGQCTVIHIAFPDLFEVDVTGPITANVKLADTFSLSGAGAGTLGDIYITGFGLDIYAGSWVDIWAH